jgi:hypothetical protein
MSEKMWVTFYITGDSYRQVQQYRQEMDQRVLRNQIERRGSAFIVRFQGKPGLVSAKR